MAGELAIVLSGGGAKGAFQVGVLDALIEDKKVDFDISVGTSTGAIQAAAVAQDDIPRLINFWTSIKKPDDIYRKRGGKLLSIITGQPSLYTTAPLKTLLQQSIDEQKIRATGKRLRIGIVNLTNGEFRVVGENAPNLADWVYASCAMPFVFPPQDSRDALGNDEQWVDGGVRDVTPLDTALNERPRAVLVVRASAPAGPKAPKKYGSLVSIGLRAVDILQNEVSTNDLKDVNLINQLLNSRDRLHLELKALNLTDSQIAKAMLPLETAIAQYHLIPVKVIEPPQNLYDTLDFDPRLIAQAIEMGRDLVNERWAELEQFLGV
ncbi:MAG TPA: patatin-like phospholipase family protein [Sphingomicrobium sp.]|nr:patatin-like phospholipase family protein [Sphingomicrobium sp.]